MNTSLNQVNKALVWNFWRDLQTAEPGGAPALFQSLMTPDVAWHGPDPILSLHGVDDIVARFWQPLLRSFPDLRRQTHLFFGGASNGRRDGDMSRDGRMWVTGTGSFSGTFTQDYLDIPATGSPVTIRWGEFYRLEDRRIVEIFCLLDLVDLMQQAGCEVLPPSLGADGIYPPPEAGDGILLEAQDRQQSDDTLDHIWRFIFEGLNSYDEDNLASMGLGDFFHPRLKWYGPGGIGACYSHKEFEDHHQAPWLHAFPDRQVQDLDALIAEGSYSGGPGWAGVKATHTGEYKGVAATGNALEFNGLDWWKRDGDQLVENWVFVDMVHLFRQLGVDLFERITSQPRTHRR